MQWAGKFGFRNVFFLENTNPNAASDAPSARTPSLCERQLPRESLEIMIPLNRF